MPKQPAPTEKPPFPFKLLKQEGDVRIIMNMLNDNLYLEVWSGSFWKSITDTHLAKKILKK